MHITSKQKKTLLPLMIFIASCVWYAYLLGGPWFFLALPTMLVSLGVLLACNIESWVKTISAWLDRDGW